MAKGGGAAWLWVGEAGVFYEPVGLFGRMCGSGESLFGKKAMKTTNAIPKLQRMLDDIVVAKTKAWWERYLRGVIPFRGVGIPEIREALAAWRDETGIACLPVEEQLPIALALFEEPIAEDKLAGVLFLQYYLQDRLPWRSLFDSYESLYQRDLIFDWNTCDWFCVRVLGPTLVREGSPCAQALRTWSTAEHLWHARSGVVPFVKVASDRNYQADIEAVCATLIRREERFAKTSVGWLLRDVSRHDEEFVRAFIEKHAGSFSIESLRNAAKYFDREARERYVEMIKGGEHLRAPGGAARRR